MQHYYNINCEKWEILKTLTIKKQTAQNLIQFRKKTCEIYFPSKKKKKLIMHHKVMCENVILEEETKMTPHDA